MLRKLIDMLLVFPRSIMNDRRDIDAILNRSVADALRSDWEAVGDDMRNAMDQMCEDLAQTKPDEPPGPEQV